MFTISTISLCHLFSHTFVINVTLILFVVSVVGSGVRYKSLAGCFQSSKTESR